MTSRLQRNALVLLSGGLDSAVVLHLALEEYEGVAAVAFRYGQPHGIEVTAAQMIANRRRVPFVQLMIGEAVRGLNAITPPEPGLAAPGVSRASLPGRNLIFIACAAAHGARLWSGGRFDVLLGANINDSAGFPDCRADFIRSAGHAVSFGMIGSAGAFVRAPWVDKAFTKSQIVQWAAERPEALEDARASLSCYAGTRCGRCDACVLRAQAFEANGLEDGFDVPGLPAQARA